MRLTTAFGATTIAATPIAATPIAAAPVAATAIAEFYPPSSDFASCSSRRRTSVLNPRHHDLEAHVRRHDKPIEHTFRGPEPPIAGRFGPRIDGAVAAACSAGGFAPPGGLRGHPGSASARRVGRALHAAGSLDRASLRARRRAAG